MKTAKEMKDNCKYPTTVNSIINNRKKNDGRGANQMIKEKINEFNALENRKENRNSFLDKVKTLIKDIEEKKEARKKIKRDEFINMEIPEIQERILELIKLNGKCFTMNYSPKLLYNLALSHAEIYEILEKELEGFYVVGQDDYFIIRLDNAKTDE